MSDQPPAHAAPELADAFVCDPPRKGEEYQAGYRAGYSKGRNYRTRPESLTDYERNEIAVQWLRDCVARLIKQREAVEAQLRIAEAEVALLQSGFVFPAGYFSKPAVPS